MFCRNLRERKNIGGLDSVGIAAGTEILKRVKTELEKSGVNDVDALISVNPEVNDCNSMWWTNTVETDQIFLARLNDFSNFLRFTSFSSVVLVGHSLWLRSLFKAHSVDTNFVGARHKLCNAGCVKMDWVWNSSGILQVQKTKLLFGSTFEGCK